MIEEMGGFGLLLTRMFRTVKVSLHSRRHTFLLSPLVVANYTFFSNTNIDLKIDVYQEIINNMNYF